MRPTAELVLGPMLRYARHGERDLRMAVVAVTGWETSERVLESGGFESRQRVLVAEPVVEASEAGARSLGVSYWQAVDRFTRGGVRASWTGDGGKLKLLGGATAAHLRAGGALVRRRSSSVAAT